MTVVISCYATDNVYSATLVFDTLRVGFPTANVIVCWNGIGAVPIEVLNLSRALRFNVKQFPDGTTNDKIAEWAVQTIHGTVVLCDSDVIFWDCIENIELTALLTGRFIRAHWCQYLRVNTVERLHPSLLFIKDTIDLISKVRIDLKITSRFAPFYPFAPQLIVGQDNKLWFYDTAAQLYKLIKGNSFDDNTLNKYDHLFCSSFVNDVSNSGGDFIHLRDIHSAIYNEPNLARGLYIKQQEYFNRNAIKS